MNVLSSISIVLLQDEDVLVELGLVNDKSTTKLNGRVLLEGIQSKPRLVFHRILSHLAARSKQSDKAGLYKVPYNLIFFFIFNIDFFPVSFHRLPIFPISSYSSQQP